jgi:hypothetical protein
MKRAHQRVASSTAIIEPSVLTPFVAVNPLQAPEAAWLCATAGLTPIFELALTGLRHNSSQSISLFP